MSSNNVKHEIVTCRMTESDYQTLRKKSIDLDMSMSDYIRYLVRIPSEVTQQESVHTCIIIDNKTMSHLLRETKHGNTIHDNQYRVLNALREQVAQHMLRYDEAAQLL